MKLKIVAVSIALALVAAAVVAAETAKITMEQARKIALQRVSGTIESGELEREHGKLIYSFDIRVPHKSGITEVAVDAVKGSIVDVHHETPAKEAAEKKQESKDNAGTSKH